MYANTNWIRCVALNNAAGATILPLDAISVRKFYDEAAYFRVAAAEDHLAGFLIGLRENADYASDNFLWFRERYPEFLYIDRIVIARPYRGAGLGRVFYADVTSFAEVRVPLLACEVFLEPRDDIAVLFMAPTDSTKSASRTWPMSNAGFRCWPRICAASPTCATPTSPAAAADCPASPGLRSACMA